MLKYIVFNIDGLHGISKTRKKAFHKLKLTNIKSITNIP